MPKDLKIAEIATMAKTFSHDIFSDWTQLNAMLKRFKALIRKRWLKKSAKQRREILLAVQPTMPLVHRPDFEGFRNLSNPRLSRKITCNAEGHLTPFINLEDLSQGHNLLLFVQSRGRSMPKLFASIDAANAHLGPGWLMTPEPDGIAMLLDVGVPMQAPCKYGMLVPVSKLPPSVGVVHSYDPISGLLVLEIQRNIYGFLLRCVQQILHDIPQADYKLAPHLPSPGPLVNAPGVWETASMQTLQADYCTPQEKASISRLSLLIDGRRLAAEDHLSSLREDPGYFLEHLREWREHCWSAKADMQTADYWCAVAGEVTAKALDALHTWSWLAQIVKNMQPIDVQLGRTISDGTRLDPRDEIYWEVVDFTISMMIERTMEHLKCNLPRSSGLRQDMRPHKHGSCKTACTNGAEYGWHIRYGAPNAVKRICKIFHMLAGLDSNQLHLHGFRPVVQEAHHMLENDNEVSQLIDDWLMSDFLELAVLADLRECIGIFLPYSRSWQEANPTETGWVHVLLSGFRGNSNHLMESARNACFDIKSWDVPTDGRFYYPSDKRRTAETVPQLQRAERNLKNWWSNLRFYMKPYGIRLDVFLTHHLAKNPLDVYSTPDWEVQATAPTSKQALSGDPQHHFPVISPNGNENKKTEIEPEKKTKHKTHGAGSAGATASPTLLPENIDPTTVDRIPILIPRRAFKVMSALLPSPSTISKAPREVSWDDFLHALNAIGFMPEKLYGSVWVFKPLPEGEGLVSVERSIQFHEPKGVRRGGKIDLIIVRQFGDRLKRAFGWDGETFACA